MFRRKERNESEVLKELNELQEAAAEVEKRPRMSGSLIQNPHDDITTRIKNIEHIEIGKHRLRYFFQFFPTLIYALYFSKGKISLISFIQPKMKCVGSNRKKKRRTPKRSRFCKNANPKNVGLGIFLRIRSK